MNDFPVMEVTVTKNRSGTKNRSFFRSLEFPVEKPVRRFSGQVFNSDGIARPTNLRSIMALKREHVAALTGLVDSLVAAGVDLVDKAEEAVGTLDDFVHEAAVALTNVVDVIERFAEPEGEAAPVVSLTDRIKRNAAAQGLDLSNIFDPETFAKFQKVVKDMVDDEKTEQAKSKSWEQTTDSVKDVKAEATAPVENEPKDDSLREYKVKYLLALPSVPYSEAYLSMLTDGELHALYDHYKARYF